MDQKMKMLLVISYSTDTATAQWEQSSVIGSIQLELIRVPGKRWQHGLIVVGGIFGKAWHASGASSHLLYANHTMTEKNVYVERERERERERARDHESELLTGIVFWRRKVNRNIFQLSVLSPLRGSSHPSRCQLGLPALMSVITTLITHTNFCGIMKEL